MTNKELATLVADALCTASQTIYDGIADVLASLVDVLSTASKTIYDGIADVVDEQPVPGAETATGDANATAATDVQPEVIAAAIDVVATAEVLEEKREAINDAYKAADVADADYQTRLADALAILKGGK